MPEKTAIELETVVKASSQQASTDVGGETAILNVQTGVYYALDKVGVFIWSQLQQPRRVADVRDAILAAYDVQEPQCRTDLLELLADLEQAGLIERVEDCSTDG